MGNIIGVGGDVPLHSTGDSNATVPQVSVAATFDVIVIGAGIAGLEIYRKLTMENDLTVGLLEARTRPGGRILTVLDNLGGTENVSIDLGASWIHGSVLVDGKESNGRCTPPSLDELKDAMKSSVSQLVRSSLLENPLISMASVFNISLQEWPFQSFSDSSAYDLNASWFNSSGFVAYDVSSPSSSSPQDAVAPISFDKIQSAWSRYCLLMNSVVERSRHHVALNSSTHKLPRSFFQTFVKDHISFASNSSTLSTLSTLEQSLIDLFIDAFEDDVGATLDTIHPHDWDFASSLFGIDHIVDPGMSSFVDNILNHVNHIAFNDTNTTSVEGGSSGGGSVGGSSSEQSTVLYNATVSGIQWNDSDTLIVTTKNGVQYKARDSIVVTVPISVLQQDSPQANSSSALSNVIQFQPILPIQTYNAIHSIGMGHSMKVFIRFKTIFWPKNATLLAAVGGEKQEEKLLFTMYWSLSSRTNNPVLVTAATGAIAQKMESWTTAKLTHHVLRSLRAMYGRNVVDANFLGLKHTTWSTDPYSLGAYSYPKNHPNGPLDGIDGESRSALNDVLGVNETLFFAGEATSEDYYGTVHGALMSGVRVARSILQHHLLDELHDVEGKPPAVVVQHPQHQHLQSSVMHLNLYNMDEEHRCHAIGQNIIKLSMLNNINNITLHDVSALDSTCWASFLHLFQYLVGCNMSINSINMSSIGLTSEHLVQLAQVFVPPLNSRTTTTDRTAHVWCGVEQHVLDTQLYPRRHQQQQQAPPQQSLQHYPLKIDLSGNDIVDATGLIKSWLKWRRPRSQSAPHSMLPLLDLSDNEIDTRSAIQIARLLQRLDKQYDRRNAKTKHKKGKVVDNDVLLGCLLLHDNQIEEEGLFELSRVSSSRWCITLHENIWEDIPFGSFFPTDCACNTKPLNEIINKSKKKTKSSLDCIRTNARDIVHNVFSGQDDWSNQLWNEIFQNNKKEQRYGYSESEL
jgi:monoamine oxidase